MVSFIKFSESGKSILLTSRLRAVLLAASSLPAAAVAIFFIVFGPSVVGAYVSDIIFWSVLIVLQVVILITAGSINYRLIIHTQKLAMRKRWNWRLFGWSRKAMGPNRRAAFIWTESLIVTIVLVHIGLHITNPYARYNIVQQPYTTSVQDGQIVVHNNFRIHAASGPLASALGYYKSGFLIIQNAWFGSYRAQSRDTDGIIDDIHTLRFDPSKPYLISGDQFSVLYPRNLGVFYNSLLDYRTAHSQQDWEDRQRIYLQSALYALDAFSSSKQLTTTIVPISPRSVVLTEVHPGSIASDSLYGILYALDQLENAVHVQTSSATKQIINDRRGDLKMLLALYKDQVQDDSTGLVKRGIHLASARDGILRDSSFYDNVVFWKTLVLADKLGIEKAAPGELNGMRQQIMATFWQSKAGFFKDDQKSSDYSSDWLIAMPTGFLSVDNVDDRAKIQSIIRYIKDNNIDQPFPIRYSLANNTSNVPFAVKKFVPNYGGDAIWSYWGAQYIYLLGQMYQQSHDKMYESDAKHFIQIYRDKIELTRGFPETFTTSGDFLENPFYKSIRQTGWVVQFELAEAEMGMITR